MESGGGTPAVNSRSPAVRLTPMTSPVVADAPDAGAPGAEGSSADAAPISLPSAVPEGVVSPMGASGLSPKHVGGGDTQNAFAAPGAWSGPGSPPVMSKGGSPMSRDGGSSTRRSRRRASGGTPTARKRRGSVQNTEAILAASRSTDPGLKMTAHEYAERRASVDGTHAAAAAAATAAAGAVTPGLAAHSPAAEVKSAPNRRTSKTTATALDPEALRKLVQQKKEAQRAVLVVRPTCKRRVLSCLKLAYRKLCCRKDDSRSGKRLWRKARLVMRAVSELKRTDTVGEMGRKIFGSAVVTKFHPRDRDVEVPYVLHPRGQFRRAWDAVMSVFVLILLFWIPFQLGFDYNVTDEGNAAQHFWYAMEITMDIYFSCDIFLNFRTAYFDDGELVDQPIEIARHYAKVWLWIDLFSTIPYGRIVNGIAAASGEVQTDATLIVKLPRVLRFARLARLMRLMRVLKIRRLLDEWEELGAAAGTFLRLFSMAFWLIVVGHFLGCAWFFVADTNDLDHTTWAYDYGLRREDDFAHKYLVSVYWAFVTVTTVGYGDVTPVNDAERVFVIFCMFIGNGFFAFMIGKMTTMAQQVNASQQMFQEKMDAVNEFMRHRGLPKALRARIRNFYEVFWPRSVFFNETAIISELSFSLRKDVAFFLQQDLIQSVPFFQDADPNFVAELIFRLKPGYAQRGEFIIQIGELGREMFLLYKGEVVVTDYGNQHSHRLGDGSFFGEIALLDPNLKRTANVQAISACELYTLSREALEEVLKHYPDFARAMYVIAESRLAKTRDDYLKLKKAHDESVARKYARRFAFGVKKKVRHRIGKEYIMSAEEIAHHERLLGALKKDSKIRTRAQVDKAAQIIEQVFGTPMVTLPPARGEKDQKGRPRRHSETDATPESAALSALGERFREASNILEDQLAETHEHHDSTDEDEDEVSGDEGSFPKAEASQALPRGFQVGMGGARPLSAGAAGGAGGPGGAGGSAATSVANTARGYTMPDSAFKKGGDDDPLAEIHAAQERFDVKLLHSRMDKMEDLLGKLIVRLDGPDRRSPSTLPKLTTASGHSMTRFDSLPDIGSV